MALRSSRHTLRALTSSPDNCYERPLRASAFVNKTLRGADTDSNNLSSSFAPAQRSQRLRVLNHTHAHNVLKVNTIIHTASAGRTTGRGDGAILEASLCQVTDAEHCATVPLRFNPPSDRQSCRFRPRRPLHEGNARDTAMWFLPGDHPDLGPAGRGPKQIRRLQRVGGSGAAIRYGFCKRHKSGIHGTRKLTCWSRHQGVLRLAHDPTVVRRQGVRRRLRYPRFYAPEWRTGKIARRQAGSGIG